MKLIVFMLLFILPLYTAETSTDLAQYGASASFSCHPSAQTLGSSKIDCKQHTIQHFRLKNWIPVSATCMTESNLTHSPVSLQQGIRKKRYYFDGGKQRRKLST